MPITFETTKAQQSNGIITLELRRDGKVVAVLECTVGAARELIHALRRLDD